MFAATFKDGKCTLSARGMPLEAGTCKLEAKGKALELHLTCTEGMEGEEYFLL